MWLLVAGLALWMIAFLVCILCALFLAAAVVAWAAGRVRSRAAVRALVRRREPDTLVWLRTPVDKRELEIAYLADEAERYLGRLD
jgi:hypothetical protein